MDDVEKKYDANLRNLFGQKSRDLDEALAVQTIQGDKEQLNRLLDMFAGIELTGKRVLCFWWIRPGAWNYWT